ncbi:MAG: hypothetical protein Q8N91_01980, partial [Candidatus Omnitrophota bacterium]|nr:hypothetical protein [Candidatus Omnitrophota bacterium]
MIGQKKGGYYTYEKDRFAIIGGCHLYPAGFCGGRSWPEGYGIGSLEGKEFDTKDAGATIAAGISLASEDRKRYGLVLDEDICRNISLASLDKISKYRVVNLMEEIKSAEHYTKD